MFIERDPIELLTCLTLTGSSFSRFAAFVGISPVFSVLSSCFFTNYPSWKLRNDKLEAPMRELVKKYENVQACLVWSIRSFMVC